MKKALAFAAPVAAAVLFFVFMDRTKDEPAQRGLQEIAVAVRTIMVQPMDLTPKAVGYGYIQPELVWDAVAEVEGKIVEVHPQLKRGSLALENELLMRIDPAKRLTATTRNEAEVRRLLAELDELSQQKSNLLRKLEVERRSLTLSEREMERKRKLVEQDVLSVTELDQQERSALTQKNLVRELENQLALIPAQQEEIQAQLEQARSSLSEARIDLESTRITAPFDSRIREINVELGQAVSVGQVLARLDSIGVSEALAEIPLHVMRRIAPRGEGPLGRQGSLEIFRRALNFKALVHLSAADRKIVWEGRLVRIREEVNPDTRTVGVYVAVDDPYLQAVPGSRPPLMRNMFCEVEIYGRVMPDSIVLPRSAVRQGFVLVVDEENRLRRRQAVVDMSQDDLVLIAEGLEGGEQIVVGDLAYAVDGMLLSPSRDEGLELSVRAQAMGPFAGAAASDADNATQAEDGA